MIRNWPLTVLSILFVIRLAVSFVHGHAHDELAVPLAPWQNAFVWLVIAIGPILAMTWLWIRPNVSAAWMLAGMLAAGWVFGLYFHFGPMNPDHVAVQPPGHGREMFVATAVALGIVEPLATVAAIWLARTLQSAGVTKHA